jgi:hypothetical protein
MPSTCPARRQSDRLRIWIRCPLADRPTTKASHASGVRRRQHLSSDGSVDGRADSCPCQARAQQGEGMADRAERQLRLAMKPSLTMCSSSGQPSAASRRGRREDGVFDIGHARRSRVRPRGRVRFKSSGKSLRSRAAQA